MSEFDTQPGEAPAAAPAPTTEAPAAPAPAAPGGDAPSPEGGSTPDFNKIFEAINTNSDLMRQSLEAQNRQAPPEDFVNPFETPAPGPFQQQPAQPAPPQQQQAPAQQAYQNAYGPDDFPDGFLAGDPDLGYPDTQVADITQHPVVQQLAQQNQAFGQQIQQLTTMFDNFATRDAAAEVVTVFPELADPQKANEAALRAYQYAQENGLDPKLAKNPKIVGAVLALDKEMARQANQEPAPTPAGDNFETPGGPGPSNQNEATDMAARMRAVSQPGF